MYVPSCKAKGRSGGREEKISPAFKKCPWLSVGNRDWGFWQGGGLRARQGWACLAAIRQLMDFPSSLWTEMPLSFLQKQ